MSPENICAIYVRLSREDLIQNDSKSIENQINILSNYATLNNMVIYRIYKDDGYSGNSLNRPGFNNMIIDMKLHKFSIILIKDLSRLSRNFYQISELMEITFPLYHIRLIAVSDNYDSLKITSNETIVFKNFLNSYYLKEFKKKINKSLIFRANNKHMISKPKYGYLINDKNELEIDEFSSKVVKEIFNLAIKGNKISQITKFLNDNNILTRNSYKTKINDLNKHWTNTMVWSILNDIEYCGHSVNLKYSKKYEEIIIKNNHPKIIDDDTFFKASLIINKKKKNQAPKNISKMLIFENDNTKVRCCYLDRKEPTYSSSKYHFNIKIDYMHDLIFNDCLDYILDIILFNPLKIKSIIKKKIFKNDCDIKMLINDINKLNNKYQKLFELKINNNIKGYDLEINRLNDEIKEKEKYIKIIEEKDGIIEKVYKKLINLKNLKNILKDYQIDIIKKLIEVIFINKNINDVFTFKIQYKI